MLLCCHCVGHVTLLLTWTSSHPIEMTRRMGSNSILIQTTSMISGSRIRTNWLRRKRKRWEKDWLPVEVDRIFASLIQGDKKRRKRKESKPGKQVKEVTKKKFASVDKEFISDEVSHQMQQQSVSSGGYVGDPQPVNSSPATQPKHAAPDNYVHGQSIVSCLSSNVEIVCMACTCYSCNLGFSVYNFSWSYIVKLEWQHLALIFFPKNDYRYPC